MLKNVKSKLIAASTVVAFLLAFSHGAFAATSGSTKFSVDANDAVLELTIPSPAVLNLTPTVSGAFSETTISATVATNNQTGYTLTLSGANPSALTRTDSIIIDEEETTPTIPTLSSATTIDNFPADKWGYKKSGNIYSPSTTQITWTEDEPTNGTLNPLTVAAKVSIYTPSGAYETTLNYQAVTNAVVAKDIISFDANGGTGTMDSLEVIAGNTATLPENTFVGPGEGYHFVGWKALDDSDSSVVGYYADESTYTATGIGYNRSITMYAQWNYCTENCPQEETTTSGTGTTLQRAYEIAYTNMRKGMYEEDTPGSDTYTYIDSWNGGRYQGNGRDVRFLIQDMTPEICASATAINSEAHVLDIRDRQSYWITKLGDGHCWMTQDLRFFITGETLTHAYTDIGWDDTSTRISWTPPSGAITEQQMNNRFDFVRTAVSREPNRDIHIAGQSQADYYNIIDETDNTLHMFSTLSACVAGGYTKEHCEHSYLGIYYNWAAATAVDAIPNPIENGTRMPDSVCSSHWRLPTSAEYTALLNYAWWQDNHRWLFQAPYYFTGTWNMYSATPTGERAWASDAPDNNSAYMIDSATNQMTSWTLGGYEVTVRCIAR